MNRSRAFRACVALAFLLPAALARGQSREYTLTPEGVWTKVREPSPGSDEATISAARALIARGEHAQARSILNAFIEANEYKSNPWMPEALLLHGDTNLARGREESALRDYERVVTDFPQSDTFVRALEREFEICRMYLGGLKRKILGLRLESGLDVAEEFIVRIGERLPDSRLAEQALIELADHYFAQRDLPAAVEAYAVFQKLYPRSEYRQRTMARLVYANVARFKGPRYDATPLREAAVQAERFATEFPAQAERAGVTDAIQARIDESLGEQMLETARWYLSRGDPVSARFTLQRLLRRHPQSVAAARGLDLLREHGWVRPGQDRLLGPGAVRVPEALTKEGR